MNNMLRIVCCFICTICLGYLPAAAQVKNITFDRPPPFHPPTYVCYQTNAAITVDGKLSAEEWDAVPPVGDFADITGDSRLKPSLQTTVQMAHNEQGLYLAIRLEEPHIWGTITQHDAAIYQENAMEVFFNPSNDTHHYLEYEVNALGTEWDLYLSRPYRDNPVTFSNWEFTGMQSAVHVDGTVNHPGDTDKAWTVEIFIPWRSLYQVVPRARKPVEGTQMRVNFMRVQWPLEVKNGAYVKASKKDGKPAAESYWVWSPTGTRNIHLPEYWGYVQFTGKVAGTDTVAFAWNTDEDIKWALRNLYYRQKQLFKAYGEYASTLSDLKPAEVCKPDWVGKLTLANTPSQYEITLSANGKTWHIRQDGLVWSSNETKK